MTIEIDNKSIGTAVNVVKDLSNKFFGTINHALSIGSLWDAIDKMMNQ